MVSHSNNGSQLGIDVILGLCSNASASCAHARASKFSGIASKASKRPIAFAPMVQNQDFGRFWTFGASILDAIGRLEY